MTKQTIIITSNEPWGEVWFSKQHYANELPKLGHEVFFLNAPTLWSPLHLFSFSVKKKQIREHLTVLSYNNNFPLKIFPALFLKLNDFINSWKISNVVGKRSRVLWWQFDPLRFVDICFFKNICRIYHVTDPFVHLFSDRLLAQKADMVVLLLNRYLEYYSRHNKQILMIPHGISEEEYIVNQDKVLKHQSEYGVYILYIGTLNDHYNIDLIYSIAKEFRRNTVLLIGPDELTDNTKRKTFDALRQLPNVKWIGAKPAGELKNYVAGAKLCMVPYDFNIESNKGSSIKILQYLAQEKIIITSIATGFEHLLDKGIYFASNEKIFLSLLEKGLSGSLPFDSADINNYLKSIHYADLIDKILTNDPIKNHLV